MYESFIERVRKWNTTKTERQKLQDVYLLLGVVIVLLSGLIAFLNAQAGHTLVTIGLLLLATFTINGIAWHLLSSIILSKIGSRPKKK